jgi:hypothetical protein
MKALLGWIESTPLSVWTRESTSVWAFPAILSAHAIGMALAAGVSAAIALGLLGVGPGIPAPEMRRFVRVLWAGFWLNAASGVLLLVAYPTKALTNPVFYLKLLLIAAAMMIFLAIARGLALEGGAHDTWAARTGRGLAVASLVSWTGAITAGRMLAYTYRHLLVDF